MRRAGSRCRQGVLQAAAFRAACARAPSGAAVVAEPLRVGYADVRRVPQAQMAGRPHQGSKTQSQGQHRRQLLSARASDTRGDAYLIEPIPPHVFVFVFASTILPN